ncbi:hypothetical protein D3C78_1233320 [compost metagenome]
MGLMLRSSRALYQLNPSCSTIAASAASRVSGLHQAASRLKPSRTMLYISSRPEVRAALRPGSMPCVISLKPMMTGKETMPSPPPSSGCHGRSVPAPEGISRNSGSGQKACS